jgi:TP901 family phage tail tape measure protein
MALEAGSVYAVLGGKFMPTGFAQFDAAMKKSAASAGAAEAQINRSSGRSAAAMGALGTAAKTGAAAGLLAVGVAAVSSVKAAQKFEKQISELRAVTRASSQDMATMRKAALDLGASTGIGATQAAQALTELAKGGLSSEKAIGALKGTIAMAQAGGMDLATAGETVANALNLFKLRGEDATMVADSFANAANATTADIGFFAQGMAQGGAAAKAAGLDFSQTTVFLEAMAANGFKSGSDAGTSMKTALIQLANPTKRAQEAAKELGVAFFDQQGQIRPLPAIAKDLGDAFDGMSKKEKLATATRLVGTDGMRALLALADQGPAKLNAFAAANSETGSAARVAAEKMNNYEGATKRLSAAFESLKIEAGTALMPALTDAANGLADFFNQLRTGEGVGGVVADIGRTFLRLSETVQTLATGVTFEKMAETWGSGFTNASLKVLGAIRAIVQAMVTASSIGGKFNPFRGIVGPQARQALSNIDQITANLRGIEARRTNIKLIADKKDVLSSIQQIQRSKIAPKVAKIQADDGDAKSKIKKLVALGIPRKVARVLADTGSAQAAISRVRSELAAITSKTVTLTVRRVGQAISGNAAGRGAGSAETALVGEGGGPEYIVDTATGRSRKVTGPTVMNLSPTEYVIPTESKYRGRALGLIAEMASDMGLVGYAKGRKGKKKESAKERKKRREREDRRIGISDTNAGRFGTEMDTAQIEGKQKAWEEARKKRLKALNTHLGRVTAARKRTKPGSQRYTELSAKASEIRNAIASTKAETYQVDPVDTGLTDGEQNQIDALDAAIALAALTEGTGDDLAALQGKAGVLAGMLESARTSGRPSRVITELAGQLKSTRDDISSLTGQAAGTPDTAGPTADEQAQNEQKMNRERINAQSAFIDRLVGATIGGAGNTLVFQSYVPPSPTEAKRLADYTVGGIGYQGSVPSSRESVGV